MKNSLAVRILRGSFFLILALIASFVPRALNLPDDETSGQVANFTIVLALFVQGIIWTNIIVSYYVQRYTKLHVVDGSSITT
ncbi:MAG: hypothetical protein ACREMS_11570, partial [Gemmatimonadaceae bacterium]